MSTLNVNTINAATSGQAVAVDIENPKSFRNLIINGAMTVAQRGTSITTGTGNFDKYTLDRWKVATHATDQLNLTVTQEAMGTALPGFASYIKVSPNVAESANDSNEYTFLRHSIEAQDLQHLGYGTSSAKSLTLSFWVKSNTTGTASITFEKHDATAYYITRTYTINTADTWEKKTVTIPGLTASVINDDNGQGLNIHWILSTGTDNQGKDLTSWSTYTDGDWIYGHVINLTDSTSDYLALTGVQLEVNSYSTDFEYRPKSYELARCQRYYYRLNSDDGSDSMFCLGWASSATVIQNFVNFPVSLRKAPDATDFEQSGTASNYRVNGGHGITNCTGVPTFETATKYSSSFSATTTSSMTTGQTAYFRSNGGSAFLAWSAEL